MDMTFEIIGEQIGNQADFGWMETFRVYKSLRNILDRFWIHRF
jgi:hypothetical protein